MFSRILTAVTEDKSILFFDPREFNDNAKSKSRKIENAHRDCVNISKFISPNLFLTGSGIFTFFCAVTSKDDCTVKLFDVRKLQCVKTFLGMQNYPP